MPEDVLSADDTLPRSGQTPGPAQERALAADGSPPPPLAGPEEPAADQGHPALTDQFGLELGRLRDEMARGHARAEAREKTIDRLHAEVERLRAGEMRLLLRPVIADLRRLRDDLLGQASALAGMPSGTKPAALLESFADSVEYTLERCGVRVVRPVPNAACDPAEHQIAGFAPTSDASLDGRIMTIVSDGYLETASAYLIAPARVIAYRETPGASPGEDAPSGHPPGSR